jgi:hypothetical protein
MKCERWNVVVLDLTTNTLRVEVENADRKSARRFCRGYNRDEASQPSGLWATAVPTPTTSTIKRRELAAIAVNS